MALARKYVCEEVKNAMKKCLVLMILFLGVLVALNIDAKASKTYLQFQELHLDRGHLLSTYTDSEYEKYYKNVTKTKFMGWRTYEVYKDVHCSFVSKTIFSYYNRGTSKITYTYNLSETETEKFSISASGSISYSLQTNKEKAQFKHGLQAALKLDVNYDKQKTITEKKNLDIVVDPNSVANLKILGEGKLTNGVAAYYFCFIRMKKGGFEYFIVTTEYPRLEVLPI